MHTGNGRIVHLLGCLGRGGFGEVYRARIERPSGLSTLAAAKVLRQDVDPGGQAVQRLKDEARLLGMLHHHAIPRVLDVLVVDDRLVMLVEYVEGVDLSAALRSDTPPGARALLEAGATVADALHAAWSTPLPDGSGRLGVVHRDLKPANIRLGRDGRARLLDFGIAWTDSVDRAAATQTSALVGSPAYMAPERFDGAPPSPANDVFGLGAVLYEGLVGRRLFGDLSLKSLAGVALFEDRFHRALGPRIAELPEHLPGPVRDMLTTMLAWSPHARPSSAEVSQRLQALASSVDGPSLAAWTRSWPWGTPVDRGGPWVGRALVETAPGVMEVREPDAGTRLAGQTWPSADDAIPSLSIDSLTTATRPIEPPTAPGGPVPRVIDVAVQPDLPPAAWGPAMLAVLSATSLAAMATVIWLAAAPPPPVAVAARPAPEVPVDAFVGPPGPVPLSPPVEIVRAMAATAQRTPAATSPALPRVDALLPAPATPAPATPAAPPPEPERAAEPAAPPRVEAVMATLADAPPAPPPGTRVAIDAAADVRDVHLTDGTTRIALPAQVPPGRYTIEATFPDGIPQVAGRIEVDATPLAVRCARGLCRSVALAER